MDLLNSNNYTNLDSFYSLETLPPLNFLADATLLFEGQQQQQQLQQQSSSSRDRYYDHQAPVANHHADSRSIAQQQSSSYHLIHPGYHHLNNGIADNGGGGGSSVVSHHQHSSHVTTWSNHESFDLLINAAISEGAMNSYDQNSRLSPDGCLLYGPSDVPTYANLVDSVSQNSRHSSSSATNFVDSLVENGKKSNDLDRHKLNEDLVCHVDNGSLSIDLSRMFTQDLLNSSRSLIKQSKTGEVIPVSLKFPHSTVKINFRLDQLWPNTSSSTIDNTNVIRNLINTNNDNQQHDLVSSSSAMNNMMVDHAKSLMSHQYSFSNNHLNADNQQQALSVKTDQHQTPSCSSLAMNFAQQPVPRNLGRNPVVSSLNEIRNQNGERQWKCHLCPNKVYKSRWNLELHLNRHHQQPEDSRQHHQQQQMPAAPPGGVNSSNRLHQSACIHCRKSFAQPSHLQSHLLRVHAPKRLPCRACSARFAHRTLLLGHMTKKCKAIGATRCDRCSQQFPNVRELGEHYTSNYGHYFASTSAAVDQQHQTLLTSVVTTPVIAAQQVVAADVTTAAPLLSVVTTSPDHYHQHQHCRADDSDTKYVCNVCNAVFGATRRLSDHKISVHDKKHVCRRCDKRFGKKIRLTQHETKCRGALSTLSSPVILKTDLL